MHTFFAQILENNLHNFGVFIPPKKLPLHMWNVSCQKMAITKCSPFFGSPVDLCHILPSICLLKVLSFKWNCPVCLCLCHYTISFTCFHILAIHPCCHIISAVNSFQDTLGGMCRTVWFSTDEMVFVYNLNIFRWIVRKGYHPFNFSLSVTSKCLQYKLPFIHIIVDSKKCIKIKKNIWGQRLSFVPELGLNLRDIICPW